MKPEHDTTPTPPAAAPKPWQATFRPMPDITAFELAILIPYLQGEQMSDETWANLGKVTRHLVRT